jgi:3-methyladenine DNA glycosylase AlkD
MPTPEAIRAILFALQDTAYRDFTAKLIPNVDSATIIGIRAPAFRKAAKEIYKAGENDAFLRRLPHDYFEETNLHAFLVTQGKDFDAVVRGLDEILPYIDNWASCDSIRPPVFQKEKERLFCACQRWLKSDRPYTVRFSMEMLMTHFLDSAFTPEVNDLVAAVQSEHYYVQMMQAWHFATALAKQWDATLPYLTEQKLEPWVHNKTIQKARESFRITPEQKELLGQFRIR